MFLPDNKTLLIAEQKIRDSATLSWWNTTTGKEIRKSVKKSSAEGQIFALSANGIRAAIVINMKMLCLWNAVTGEEIASTILEESNGADAATIVSPFAQDGRTLAPRRRQQDPLL